MPHLSLPRTALLLLPVLLGAWEPFSEASRIDGKIRVGIQADQIDITYGDGPRVRPFIRIVCNGGVTYAWLHFDRVMTCGSGQTVAYRADDKPPHRTWMGSATDCKTLGMSGTAAVGFVRNLLDASWLYLRATPHASGPAEYQFYVAGLREAIPPVARACRWPGNW